MPLRELQRLRSHLRSPRLLRLHDRLVARNEHFWWNWFVPELVADGGVFLVLLLLHHGLKLLLGDRFGFGLGHNAGEGPWHCDSVLAFFLGSGGLCSSLVLFLCQLGP